MRQFGLYQTVPPPDPITEELWRRLHVSKDATYDKNWSTTHADFVAQASEPDAHLVEEDRWFDPDDRPYREWYQDYGTFTVYLHGMMSSDFSRPIPIPRDSTGAYHGYIPSGPPLAQIVSLRLVLISSPAITPHVLIFITNI